MSLRSLHRGAAAVLDADTAAMIEHPEVVARDDAVLSRGLCHGVDRDLESLDSLITTGPRVGGALPGLVA
jgi:hypothetical protein